MAEEKKHWSENPIISGIIVAIFTTLFSLFITNITKPDDIIPEETPAIKEEQQVPTVTTFHVETTNPAVEGDPPMVETTPKQENDTNGTGEGEERVYLLSVSIDTLPHQRLFMVGDTLVEDGLTLKAVYSDGTSKKIKTGFVCEPTVLSSAGSKTITVSYDGKMTFFVVDVENVWSDWVTELPVGVSSTTHDIQEKTQYASSKITAWRTLSDGAVGLSMYDFYDRTEFRTEISEWSDWYTEDDSFVGALIGTPVIKYYYSKEEEVEHATQYRSCEKIDASGNYGEWGEWQFSELTETDNRKVETREVTRKRQKVVFSTRYYYQVEDGLWEDPIYVDSPINKDENTAVKTRIVYRYREKVN